MDLVVQWDVAMAVLVLPVQKTNHIVPVFSITRLVMVIKEYVGVKK
jgi:hypothetical protein